MYVSLMCFLCSAENAEHVHVADRMLCVCTRWQTVLRISSDVPTDSVPQYFQCVKESTTVWTVATKPTVVSIIITLCQMIA